MKTHKWAARILGAGLIFVGAIWFTAPVSAADVIEHQPPEEIVQFIEQESACYALAKVIGDEYQIERHIFNLKLFVDEYSYTMIHTIGYTEGYLAAVSYLAKVPKAILAADRYTGMCLEKA